MKHKNLTGDRNQCCGCHELFNSVFAFDKHRLGAIGVDRHCASPEEMLIKGMSKNAKGFWISAVYVAPHYAGIDSDTHSNELEGVETGADESECQEG